MRDTDSHCRVAPSVAVHRYPARRVPRPVLGAVFRRLHRGRRLARPIVTHRCAWWGAPIYAPLVTAITAHSPTRRRYSPQRAEPRQHGRLTAARRCHRLSSSCAVPTNSQARGLRRSTMFVHHSPTAVGSAHWPFSTTLSTPDGLVHVVIRLPGVDPVRWTIHRYATAPSHRRSYSAGLR